MTPHWTEEFFESPTYEEEYAPVYGDTERTTREVEFIVRELKLEQGDRVLDLACGPGRHALQIAEKVAGVVGTDRALGLIEEAGRAAAEQGVSNAEFLLLDGDVAEPALVSGEGGRKSSGSRSHDQHVKLVAVPYVSALRD